MPIYLVEGPDGKTHQIEGPAGATPEQIIEQAKKLIPYQQRTVSEQLPVDYREDTMGQQFKRGLGRAMTGLGGTVTDLIPAMVGSAVGAKDYAAEQMAEYKAKTDAAEQQNPTAFKSFKDIRGVGDVFGYIAETLGELGPDIAAMMTGTGAASVVGKRLALRGVEELALKKAAEKGLTGEAASALVKGAVEQATAKGSAAGITYGLPASSYALNAPDTFQNIHEATGEMHPGIAAVMGVPIAMLDTYLPGRILDKLGKAGKAKLASNLLEASSTTVIPSTFKKAALKEFGTVLASEGLTESAQEALTAASEIMAGGKEDFFSQKNIDRYINAGLKGAIGGGLFGAPGAIKEGLAAKGEKTRLEEEAKAKATPVETPQQALLLLENNPFTPVVFPDGSVATTPEQVKAYEESQFQGKYAPQQEAAPTEFTPEEIAAETERRNAQNTTPKILKGEEKLPAEYPGLTQGQEQGDLFGLTYPEAQPPVSELEDRQGEVIPEAAPTVTKKELLGLGIPKNALVPGLKNAPKLVDFLNGLSLDNPRNVDTIVRHLGEFIKNPMVKPEVKANVTQFLRGVTQATQNINSPQAAMQFAPPTPNQDPNTPMQQPLGEIFAGQQRQQQDATQREEAFKKAEAQKVAQEQQAIAQQGAQQAANERQKAARQARLDQEAEQNRLKREEKLATGYPGLAQGQEQGDLFGLTYPEAQPATPEAPAVEEEKPFATVLTAEVLAGAGLPKGSSFTRQLLNKDMADPAQQPEVASIFAEMRKHPNKNIKSAAESLAMQAFSALAKQGSLFGPRGGATPEGKYRGNKPSPAPTTGGSPDVSGQPGTVGQPAAGESAAPEPGGLVATSAPAAESNVAKEPESTPVKGKIKKPEVKKPAPKAEKETKPVPEAEATGKEKTTPENVVPEAAAPEKETKEDVSAATVPGKIKKPPKAKKEPKAEAPKKEPKAEAPKKEPKAKVEPKAEEEKAAPEVAPEATEMSGEQFNKGMREAYEGADDEIDEPRSIAAVERLRRTPFKELSPEGKAAKTYFTKKLGNFQLRVIDVLKNVAYDLAYGTPIFRSDKASSAEELARTNKVTGTSFQVESQAEADFFSGMYGEKAKLVGKWIDANLDEEANKVFANLYADNVDANLYMQTEQFQRMLAKGLIGIDETRLDATSKAYMNAEAMLRKEKPPFPELIFARSSREWELQTSLATPLHPVVVLALKNGDFAQAMRLMAQTKDPRTAKLALALLKAGVNPKVRVVKNLKNEEGVAVAGLYDPRTNTITLDSVNGMTAHTLIHETGHAALSHVLDNPNHPVTKQMQRLFDAVVPMLDTAYGAQDLQEFAAEALGNPEFRGKLNSMNPAGGSISAWQRFQNIVGNFFRKLFGVPGKPVESAMDKVDQLIDQILSPAPEYRDAGSLYALAQQPKSVVAKVLDVAFSITKDTPFMKKEIGNGETREDLWREAIKNSSTDAVRAGLLMTLPLHILSEMAGNALVNLKVVNSEVMAAKLKFTENAKMINALVNRRAGIVNTRNEQIEALVNKANRWASKAGKAMVNMFNGVVYDSTIEGVDPTRNAAYFGAYKITYEDGDDTKRESFLAETDRDARAAVLQSRGKDITVNKPDADDLATSAGKLALLKGIKDRYDKLDKGGQELYVQMRDAYSEMYKLIRKSLSSQIDIALEGEEGSENIKNELFRKLVERAHIDPYFALTRSGNYWLSYNTVDESGQVDRVVKSFMTESTWQKWRDDVNNDPARLKALKAAFPVWQKAAAEFDPEAKPLTLDAMTAVEGHTNVTKLRYDQVPSSSFISDVVKILRKNKDVKEGTVDQVVKLFLSALPETAFAKSFQKRGNITGFEKDAIGALQKKMFSTSRQIANMEYAPKFSRALRGMADAREVLSKGGVDLKTMRSVDGYFEEYNKRIKFINNPTTSALSQAMTGLGFNFLLGANPASALVNLLQVPMVLLPYLGGEYGYSEASRAVGDAYKVFTGSGRSKTTNLFGTEKVTETRTAMFSLDNLDPKSAEYKKYATLIKVMGEEGQFSSSQVYDTLEATDKVGIMQKVNATTGWMFHHAERMNRQVSVLAAYNLEMARLGTKDAKLSDGETLASTLTDEQKQVYAANHAIYIGEMTQGGTSSASAPRIAQGAVGRVMFMFKRFGVSMLYLQLRMLKDAMRGQDKATKKAAMAQFAGMTGMAALLAGVQGIPFFGVAALLYNLFKDKDDDDLEMATRKYMGVMLTNGPLSYYTNADFSGRVSLTDLLVREMRTGESPNFTTSILQELGGPLYGVASKVERGVGLWRDGHITRGLEQILPSALGNPLKAIRFYTEGASTLRGDPITGDVSAWSAGAQAFGFSPADYQRQNELSSRLKEVDKRVVKSESNLLQQYYTAGRLSDFEGQAEIKEELRDLFRKHSGLGSLQDTMNKSMEAHKKTSQKMVALHGITVSEKLRRELMQYSEDAGN